MDHKSLESFQFATCRGFCGAQRLRHAERGLELVKKARIAAKAIQYFLARSCQTRTDLKCVVAWLRSNTDSERWPLVAELRHSPQSRKIVHI